MREVESTYLLEYEKQKILGCAKSFQELANIFIYAPPKEEIKDDLEFNRNKIFLRKRLLENRELFADNLRELASIMGEVAGREIRVVPFFERKIRKIARFLEEEGLLLADIYILEGEGDKELLGVKIKSRKNVNCSSIELAGYLSVLLDRRYQTVSGTPFFLTQEFQTIYFEEEPKFSVLCGYAKATKETEEVSGDNYSFFETGNNQYVAILSDGMGSGKKACTDSELVVEMAEKFLDAGFSVETAVQMINDVLLLGEDNSNMSTLDLCCVDLMTGDVKLAKIGSANTYIKNLWDVEKIQAQSLPLGIFHKQEIHIIKRKLQYGDYIIMLSDGVADSLEKEKGEDFIKTLIADLHCERPTEMANCIMKYVLGITKGHIQDDMTILVMGFWENNSED